MNAIAVQIPGHESDEFVIAKDQPQYIPLPAVAIQTPEGIAVVTRWRPTDEERAQLAAGADIWLSSLTFGGPLQPVRLTIECPVEQSGDTQ